MDKCPAGTQGGACRERELHPEIGAVRLGRHHEGAGGSGTLPAPVRLYYLSGTRFGYQTSTDAVSYTHLTLPTIA